MKNYVLIEFQDGGCDYTIGCGYRITKFEAQDWDNALEIALSKLAEDFREEFGADTVTLFEANNMEVIDHLILQKKKKIIQEALEKENKKKEEEERKEYERLKKKFGVKK